MDRRKYDNGRIKKLTEGGGEYVEPSFFFYIDLANKAGLSIRDIDDWTPGMVVDMLIYAVNDKEKANRPKPPSQAEFDSF